MNPIPDVTPETSNAELRLAVAELVREHNRKTDDEARMLREVERVRGRLEGPPPKLPEWSNTAVEDSTPVGTIQKVPGRELVRIKEDRGWAVMALNGDSIRNWYARKGIECPDLSPYFPKEDE